MAANNNANGQENSPLNNTLRIDREQLEKALETIQLQQNSLGATPFDETPAVHSVSGSHQPRQLPAHLPDQRDIAAVPRWHIELCGLEKIPLVFDIVADVVLGVDRGAPSVPDLDLGPYGGDAKGVSRRHALLRPTWNHLFLIDLESTNGTRINSLWVSAGMAKDVHAGDFISLGKLSFTICAIAGPTRGA